MELIYGGDFLTRINPFLWGGDQYGRPGLFAMVMIISGLEKQGVDKVFTAR